MSRTDRGALLVMPRQTDRASQDVRALGAGPGGCKKNDSGAVKKIEQIWRHDWLDDNVSDVG